LGDGGLGIGDWGLRPIPNPQSPIPNPHLEKISNQNTIYILLYLFYIYLYKFYKKSI